MTERPSIQWPTLTKRQQEKLIYALGRTCSYDYDSIVWSNLIKLGLAEKFRVKQSSRVWRVEYRLTIAGEELAKYGKSLPSVESKAKRVERLYREAMGR